MPNSRDVEHVEASIIHAPNRAVAVPSASQWANVEKQLKPLFRDLAQLDTAAYVTRCFAAEMGADHG